MTEGRPPGPSGRSRPAPAGGTGSEATGTPEGGLLARLGRAAGPQGWGTVMPAMLSGTRLMSVWQQLRTSFWFLPSAMVAAAIVLSIAVVEIDSVLPYEVVEKLAWLYTFGPAGARAVLTTIAGSMITVAGLTFSITMLTLQLASSQFGPRLLRNFMRDRGNQVVLGTFIGTFIYCLLVMRTVRGTEESSFVPHIAVGVGVALALASIAVLIYFIHHVASSIRLETLLPQLAAESRASIDRLYPDSATPGPTPPDDRQVRDPLPLPAERGGYLQRVDTDALVACAAANDLMVTVLCRPGTFVTDSTALAEAGPSERLSDDALARLRAAFVVGQERTPEQDVEFSIRRIVEIAQRALSPGVNDPTTALYCIDRLGEVLGVLASRPMPSAFRFDDDGRLRVVLDPVAVGPVVRSAFAAIARYGMSDVDVVDQLLASLDHVARIGRPEIGHVAVGLASEIRARRPSDLP